MATREIDLSEINPEVVALTEKVESAVEEASQEGEQNTKTAELMKQIKKEGFVKVDGKTYKAVDTGNGLEMTEIILEKGEIKPEWGETKVLNYEDLEKQNLEVGSREETERNINEYKITQEAAVQSKEATLTKLLSEKAILEVSRKEMDRQGDPEKIDIDKTTLKEIEDTLKENKEAVEAAEQDLKVAEEDLKSILEFKGNSAS